LRNHPFWSKHISNSPRSNRNKWKSKKSGQNHYSWGGYEYLVLEETMVSPLEVKQAWAAEIGVSAPL
jgi:hypothetical protein